MAKSTFLILLLGVLSVRGVDRKARDLGVRCDGRSDDTANLNRAIASLADGDTLELPANAVCPTSNVLRIEGKKNIRIFGSGEKTEIFARRVKNSNVKSICILILENFLF